MRILTSIQGFTSLDVITSICSVTAVALIAGPILKRNFEAEGINRAEREMRELVPVVLEEKGLSSQELRGLASDGDVAKTVGADPWGQPYRFKLVKNSYGQPTHILIWSSGPNRYQDTNNIGSHEAASGPVSVVFEGDDLGFVRTLR